MRPCRSRLVKPVTAHFSAISKFSSKTGFASQKLRERNLCSNSLFSDKNCQLSRRFFVINVREVSNKHAIGFVRFESLRAGFVYLRFESMTKI